MSELFEPVNDSEPPEPEPRQTTQALGEECPF
jgi:hypothetical protein